jgi:hypothetical protein
LTDIIAPKDEDIGFLAAREFLLLPHVGPLYVWRVGVHAKRSARWPHRSAGGPLIVQGAAAYVNEAGDSYPLKAKRKP